MVDFGLLLLLPFACGRCGGGFGAFGGPVIGPFQACVLLSPSCLWFWWDVLDGVPSPTIE